MHFTRISLVVSFRTLATFCMMLYDGESRDSLCLVLHFTFLHHVVSFYPHIVNMFTIWSLFYDYGEVRKTLHTDKSQKKASINGNKWNQFPVVCTFIWANGNKTQVNTLHDILVKKMRVRLCLNLKAYKSILNMLAV